VWSLVQEKEMRAKMDIEENIRDKMLVDEIVRKTIEEDEKFDSKICTYLSVGRCKIGCLQPFISN